MIRLSILFILLSFLRISYAQTDQRKGLVITNSGDTIVGMINFQGDIKNSKVCIFYFASGKNEVFHPFDIYGYRFDGGKFYVSKYIEEFDSVNQIFAEYLVRGQKDLFYYRDYSGFHYGFGKNDSTLIEIPCKEDIIVIEGKPYLHEPTNHIGFLKSFFADCPSIFGKIDNIKKPDKNNLISITIKYHDEICGENSCIVYKKTKIPVKFAIQPRFEITRFKGDASYFTQYGGLLNLWIPESNENLFIKTGFLYSKYEKDLTMIKIPFQFEYIFPNKIIRPKFDVGFNAYGFRNSENTEGIGLTFAVAGGVLLRVTKFLYLDLNVETDIFQFTWETGFFISHSFGTGLFYIL